jgi:hypothetical protein
LIVNGMDRHLALAPALAASESLAARHRFPVASARGQRFFGGRQPCCSAWSSGSVKADITRYADIGITVIMLKIGLCRMARRVHGTAIIR